MVNACMHKESRKYCGGGNTMSNVIMRFPLRSFGHFQMGMPSPGIVFNRSVSSVNVIGMPGGKVRASSRSSSVISFRVKPVNALSKIELVFRFKTNIPLLN